MHHVIVFENALYFTVVLWSVFWHCWYTVLMVNSGLLMDQTTLRVELKCAIMQYGVQCVMTSGIVLMQVWSADSLDSPQQV